jgi:hypothetical protein
MVQTFVAVHTGTPCKAVIVHVHVRAESFFTRPYRARLEEGKKRSRITTYFGPIVDKVDLFRLHYDTPKNHQKCKQKEEDMWCIITPTVREEER